MALNEKGEELLESFWLELVEGQREAAEAGVLRHDPDVQTLAADGYITLEGDRLRLTEAGREEGRNCVRRHRLAERLMVDVLQCDAVSLHETSCRFEHLLRRGLADNICTLLGHPRHCPHGHPIPEGPCCVEARRSPEQIVVPLTDLPTGCTARVSHLHSDARETLQKILLIGALPGTVLTLVQRFPAYVLHLGNSQFAIDGELAAHIYVRPLPPATPGAGCCGGGAAGQNRPRRRFRFGFGAGNPRT